MDNPAQHYNGLWKRRDGTEIHVSPQYQHGRWWFTVRIGKKDWYIYSFDRMNRILKNAERVTNG